MEWNKSKYTQNDRNNKSFTTYMLYIEYIELDIAILQFTIQFIYNRSTLINTFISFGNKLWFFNFRVLESKHVEDKRAISTKHTGDDAIRLFVNA